MIYAFIAHRCADLPVDASCRAAKAFFAWHHAHVHPTERMLADRDLGDLVATIHEQSRPAWSWSRSGPDTIVVFPF